MTNLTNLPAEDEQMLASYLLEVERGDAMQALATLYEPGVPERQRATVLAYTARMACEWIRAGLYTEHGDDAMPVEHLLFAVAHGLGGLGADIEQ